jgi:hypothetical protein
MFYRRIDVGESRLEPTGLGVFQGPEMQRLGVGGGMRRGGVIRRGAGSRLAERATHGKQ